MCTADRQHKQQQLLQQCTTTALNPAWLFLTLLCTAGVISFSEVLADVGNHGKYSLSLYDMGRFMRLDAAAQRALNVMKTKFDANDNFSLYGLMSRARTSMGKRLLKASLTALS